MDASQYKDYVLVLLFIKYVSDKYADQPYAPITIPNGSSFKDMVALKGKSDIGDQINKKIVGPLADANKLSDMPDFNDASKLGSGKEMVDRLTNLVAIFENRDLDFSKNRAEGDDILGDAYEYLMRHFATESGKSKGQFYTPAEVSRVIAQIIGIHDAKTSASTTVYDPTCGSGSLLLKVGDEATTSVTLNGQEKDVATAGLARMNMVLHDNPTAVIEGGRSTLATPLFTEGDRLKTFDFVVANPPFSDKRWSTGIDPASDPYKRFQPFQPPRRQGDFAYLLHIVSSLKTTGSGACILPHGVLFRGNAEADIRRHLVDKGYIKGIIGLPANIFYGTGIPACIVIIDKKDAQARTGIFIVDASGGFIKEGPKNRLRAQDIHKMVDVFTRQTETPGFARMVSFEEIEENDFNLNLPRYIDSQTTEDVQDISAHLQGGIPEADVDALSRYWDVCPTLRGALFKLRRPGYLDLAVEAAIASATISEHPEFVAFVNGMRAHLEVWRATSAAMLKSLDQDCHPKDIIHELAESLLAQYVDKPLIDPYDVYQHLMDYWEQTMQDDLYLIATNGWRAETRRITQISSKGKEQDKGWSCDLVPKDLIVGHYFAKEKAAIDELAAELENISAKVAELEEEHGGEGGALLTVSTKADAQAAWSEALEAAWEVFNPSDFAAYRSASAVIDSETSRLADLRNDPRLQALRNEKGNLNNGPVKARLKVTQDPSERELLGAYLASNVALSAAKRRARLLREGAASEAAQLLRKESGSEEIADLRVLNEWFAATAEEADVRRRHKDAETSLDAHAYAKYDTLSTSEIKTLTVDDKWLATLEAAISGEVDRVSQQLASRVRELVERYQTPLPHIQRRVVQLETKVSGHLEAMGFSWT